MPAPNPDRDRKAVELHLAGVSYAQIAKAVGFSGKGSAHKAVARALLERAGAPSRPTPATVPEPTSGEPVTEVREAILTELARLDAMLTGVWPKARRGDVAAVATVLKIEERRAQLLTRVAHDAAPTAENVTPLDAFQRRFQERRASRQGHPTTS